VVEMDRSYPEVVMHVCVCVCVCVHVCGCSVRLQCATRGVETEAWPGGRPSLGEASRAGATSNGLSSL